MQTTAKSSTTVIPIITRPCSAPNFPLSLSSRAKTIVLATEIVAPMTTPWVMVHPEILAMQTAMPTMQRIPIGPPMSATFFTRARSGKENSAPIENIRRNTHVGQCPEAMYVSQLRARCEWTDRNSTNHKPENQGQAKAPSQ